MTVNEHDWKSEIQAIKHRLDLHEARQAERERAVIDEAVTRANKALMLRFGVDINDSKSVEEFSKGIQFGKSMQGTMTGLGWAFLIAICSGMGTALWLAIRTSLIKGPL